MALRVWMTFVILATAMRMVDAAPCAAVTGSSWKVINDMIPNCETGAAPYTILLDAGTFTGDGTATSLTLAGVAGSSYLFKPSSPGAVVVLSGNDAYALLAVPPGVDVTFQDVTITRLKAAAGGSSLDGSFNGGITVGDGTTGGVLSLLRVVMRANFAPEAGGAVVVRAGSTLWANYSTFENNLVSSNPGSGCSSGNLLINGGALYTYGGTIIVAGCTFHSNTAIGASDLAAHPEATGFIDASGCGNGADIFSTAFASPIATLYVTDTTFNGGRAGGKGGAIFVDQYTQAIIRNVVMSPLKAQDGLGIYFAPLSMDDTLTVFNLTATNWLADIYPTAFITIYGMYGEPTVRLSEIMIANALSTPIYISTKSGSYTLSGLTIANTRTGAYSGPGFSNCGVLCISTIGGGGAAMTVTMSGLNFTGGEFLAGGSMLSFGGNMQVSVTDSLLDTAQTTFDLRATTGAVNTAGINVMTNSLQAVFTRVTLRNIQGGTGAISSVSPIVMNDVHFEHCSALLGGSVFCSTNCKTTFQGNTTIIDSFGVVGGALYYNSPSQGDVVGYPFFAGVRDSAYPLEDPLFPFNCGADLACCNDFPSVVNGARLTRGGCLGVLGTQCPYYECEQGYTRNATGLPTCAFDNVAGTAVWDLTSACTPIACPAPQEQNHTTPITFLTKANGVGWTELPWNGRRETGTIAVYNCDAAAGYGAVSGTRTLCIGPDWYGIADSNGFTNNNAQVLGLLPQCEAGLCTNLTAPAHGSVSGSSAKFFENATYSCEAGLMVVGQRSRKCLATGLLEGTLPTCATQKCDTLANNVDNTCGDSDIAIGATCTIQCKPGYAGSAGGELRCNESAPGFRAEFLPQAPTCTLCKAGTFSQPGVSECQQCPFGITDYPGASSQTQCLCTTGFVEKTPGQGDCIECPKGGYCAGGKLESTSLPGYFKSEGAFIACTPDVACAGKGSCDPAYTGYLCGACSEGYYRLNGYCYVCPKQSKWKVIVGGVIGSLVALGLVKLAEPPSTGIVSVNFAAPTIGFSFVQVTASFIDINFQWPETLRQMCDVFSSLNLNIELTNPECTVTMTFYDKLQAYVYMPLVVLLAFIVLGLILMVRSFLKDRKIKGLFARHAGLLVSRFVAGFLLFMTLAYLFLAKATVQFFSCVLRDDGSYTLANAPNLVCYSDEWHKMLGVAVFSLVVYVFGVPFALCGIYITLRRKRGLTAASTHPLTAFFVAKYEPKYWMWECFVMLRKFLIVLWSAIFVTNPNVQALASIGVLFIAAMCTIGMKPFKWNKHDAVEITSLVASLIVLFAGLITTSEGAGSGVKTTLAGIAIFFSSLSCFVTVMCFLSELYVKIFLFRRTKQLGNPTRRVMTGHKLAATSVVLANERTLVSGSEDGSIKVWNAMTGACTHTIPAHTSGVTALAVIRTNYVLSASRDGTIALWNVHDGRKVAVVAQNVGEIRCLAADQGGSIFVSGTSEGQLTIWRTQSRMNKLREIHDDESGSELLQEFDNSVKGRIKNLLGRSGDGAAEKAAAEGGAAAGSKGSDVALSSADSSASGADELFERVQTFDKAHEGAIRAVCVDGKYVYSGGDDGFTRRWSPDSESRLATFKVHSGAVTAIAVLDGVLYTGSADATIRGVVLSSGVVSINDWAHGGAISALAVEPTTGSIISASWDNTVRVWSTKPREFTKGPSFHALAGHSMSVNAIAVHLYAGLRARTPKGDPEKVAAKKKAGKKQGSSEGSDADSIVGLIFSASDDATLRAFELNMARHLDVKDPLNLVIDRVSACLPDFTEPEAQIHKEGYSSSDDEAAAPAQSSRRGSPGSHPAKKIAFDSSVTVSGSGETKDGSSGDLSSESN